MIYKEGKFSKNGSVDPAFDDLLDRDISISFLVAVVVVVIALITALVWGGKYAVGM